MTQSQRSYYVITAKTPDGIAQQTRTMAASAMALVQSWREAGYTDVQARDPTGNVLCSERYRERVLTGTKRPR